MMKLQRRDDYDARVGFGKHKGMQWSDVPNGYLLWCVENIKPQADASRLAKAELDRRGIFVDMDRTKHGRNLAQRRSHVMATWQPPEVGSLETWDEREAEFLELVDCHPSEVLDCVRWQSVRPGDISSLQGE